MQQIDWIHLLLPFMIHCLCCVIALMIFMVQTGRAVCKYGMIQFCHHIGTDHSGIRRQAARRRGHGIDIEDIEDTEEKLATGQEMESSKEEEAAGNTNNKCTALVNIE